MVLKYKAKYYNCWFQIHELKLHTTHTMRSQTGFLSIHNKKALLNIVTPRCLKTEGIHTVPLYAQESTEYNNALIIRHRILVHDYHETIHGEGNTKVGLLKGFLESPWFWRKRQITPLLVCRYLCKDASLLKGCSLKRQTPATWGSWTWKCDWWHWRTELQFIFHFDYLKTNGRIWQVVIILRVWDKLCHCKSCT